MLDHGGRLRAAAQRYGIDLADWLDLSTGIAPYGWPLPAIPESVWQRLPEPDEDWFTIEPSQLLLCFRHPARFLLEQRLGLRLADDQESLASDEPFDLEMAAWNGLRRLSLQAMEQGWSDEEERRMACAAGWLPTGELGQALWGKLRGPVRAFAPRLFELRPDAVPEPLPVDITLAGVRVHGWLDGVTSSGLFDWRLRAPDARDLPGFWLRHLLLNLCATPGIERHSLMLSPAGDWQLGPLANAAELLASPKDRAENLMIVDLLRNDLGRSCRTGSVRVPELFALESYPNVHHLVSAVTGELADDHDALDLVAGSFPGGSITGAPKIRAMQIIDELEPTRRSIYCGSLLYVDVRGEMDSSIAIRTLLVRGGQASCWGGGGIVADSDWQAEYQESIDKVKVLLETLEQLPG